ncbi:hypothetical protein AKJ29_11915 [Aliiroseovarius crassostreae]|uniref:Uncharacterized protein n=2 Tax=Aliiroseovarius crassostreae TaxID=154981 RepID=A0A0P7IVT8_9RHOB|nr:hypothetical protein AKJ29_11915 [Aliiroseovarius crassostreae]
MVCIWLYHFEAPIWLWVVAVPFGGLVIGHLFNAWYVQFSRSLFYSRQGIKQLPENYYTALFVYDLTSLPEMFPGSEGIDAIPHWKHSVFFFPHPRNPLTFLLSLCWTFSLISIVVLRFMAKASALIYLPLVYLSWPSDFQTSLQKQMIWIKSQSAKSIELFKFWFACTTVLLFALSAFQAANMLDLNAILSDENPISTLVVLYYVTDLSKIMPWHYLSLSNSLLSIALYFLMDGCRKEAIAGQSAFPKRVSLIIIGTRLRSVLSIFWIAIVMFFTLKFYYLRCDISGIAAQVLGYFLGETCGAI